MKKVVFKNDCQNQPSLFPYSFDGFISKEHPARLINSVIDKLDITDILNTYQGGGTSSYHPRMLLKVLIYGYLNNLYSSRKIAKALKENVYFIWLSGQSFPDFRTINNFRGKRLKDRIEEIFRQVVLFLTEEGVVSLEEVFTDGTKIESVANRYTFVWKGSIEKNKARLEKKVEVLLKEISLTITEDDTSGEEKSIMPDLTSETLQEKINRINEALSNKTANKKTIRQAGKLENELLPKLKEYEQHLSTLGDRNSYSKTDHDATFMRMKEDHMKNGQLKPAYNIQLSTENNYITNFTIHQKPGDTTTFIPHIEAYKKSYGKYPEIAIADAGYGSCENYSFMDQNGIENYVKFNYFHKEQNRKFRRDISKVENLYYNKEGNFFVCPMGQKMNAIGIATRKTDTGYKYEVTYYKASNCSNCPLKGACHKQKGDRIIEVNRLLYKYKQMVRENLLSEKGIELRGRRCTEVEQTFGQLKWNKKFTRFLLKGLTKVSVEIGLIALAHNFTKLFRWLENTSLEASFVWLPLNIIETIILLIKKYYPQNRIMAQY